MLVDNFIGRISYDMIDTRELYKSNEDFKRYVDTMAKSREVSVEEILQHEIVRGKAEDIRAHEMERR
jgi:hypothetical protein